MSVSLWYITLIWLVTYMQSIRNPPTPHTFGINTVTCLISLPLQIGGRGWLVNYLVTRTSLCRCWFNPYNCIIGVSLVGSAVLR